MPENDDRRGRREWRPRGRGFDAQRHREALLALFEAVARSHDWNDDSLPRILAQHPREDKDPAGEPERSTFSKIELVAGYRQLTATGALHHDRSVLRRLQLKPVRTSSGVAPVTVLTKPAGCPGHCIYCPDAAGMPKSYLPDEPGARRAAQCGFDPYLQVHTRLATFTAMGHSAEKVELLILGGTWSAYSRPYRDWFVRRCFEAMNDGGAVAVDPVPLMDPPEDEALSGGEDGRLAEVQQRNETAPHRNVGMVVETRPDWVTPQEIVHLRRLGVTKVQLGVQSLDERILGLNRRGHDITATRRATALLRAAGFKIVFHWMPNLLGATPASDRDDFARLWSDPWLRPDELKIYPCSIVEGAALHRIWQTGAYRPYEEDELVALVADCKAMIPPYCRVNRVFRDIPADDILAGSKRSNLRQVVQQEMARRGQMCRCIRCREVREHAIGQDELSLVVHAYETGSSVEQLLGYETPAGKLAGFLRLSLPVTAGDRAGAAEMAAAWQAMPEIAGAALIREVHVYGPALGIGSRSAGEAQHLGLGRRLLAEAGRRARAAGFARLAVISAIGTRRYYERLGFERGRCYMLASL